MNASLRVCLLGLAGLCAAQPAKASPDHYIYDADVVLFDDFDSDGFFRFLSVRIDADSDRSSAYVYAALFLSPDGVEWNHYHTTDDFWIGGASGDDEIFVETELVTGYPTGEYDLLIELYDADFGTYSDEFGPLQNPDLALLPLEDAAHDPRPVQVSVDGGGGAFPIWALPLLLGLPLIRRFGRDRLDSCLAGKLTRTRTSTPS